MINIKKNTIKRAANNLLLVTLFIFTLSSCGKDYFFQKTHEIKNGQWAYNDSLIFNFTIDDTTQVFDLLIGIDHGLDYSNQNIYLEIDANFPSGYHNHQIRSFDLANNAGNWLGDCDKSGCEYIFPLQKSTFFKEKGQYQFVIKQYMRNDSLGIKQVSLYLDKIE